MLDNKSLVNAKKVKNDEFYTVYEFIQKEVNAYLEYNPNTFRGKTVLLPCDDPEWSNFTKFFAQNFEFLGLKKLISTSYSLNKKSEKQLTIFDFITDYEKQSPQYDETITNSRGKIFILEHDNNESRAIDLDDIEWSYLEGDGDFRSEEVKKLRNKADIIITNPPFSLFKEFVNWIFEAEKDCLLIGTKNAITYSEIFPKIKANKLWLGATCNSEDMVFEVLEGSYVNPKDKEKAAKMGYVGNYTRQGNSNWFTTLDHGRRHQPISLMTIEDNIKFSKHKEIRGIGYEKYDNYDAINIPFIDSIPSDYYELMGVPISFLDKYCPEQFEIIASSQTGCHPDEMVLRKYKEYIGYRQSGEKTGRTGSTCGNNPMLLRNDGTHDCYINEEGRTVQSSSNRIFIKRKE